MKDNNPVVRVVHSQVPIPVNREKYPFDDIEVGEMFEFPIKKRFSVQSIVQRRNKTGERQYTVRKINDTTAGVWRVA